MSKTAAIYNLYLNTAGGGERATLDLCLALERIGYEITLLSSPSFTKSIEDLCEIFGLAPTTKWTLKIINSENEVRAFCKTKNFDLFVNFTFCSSLENQALNGIYCVMFPQMIDKAESERLKTYNHILCISEFSNIYIEKYWGDEFAVNVLPPPISSSHMNSKEIHFNEKEKLILTVGRFNVDGHCKCQFEAIQTFNRLKLNKIIGDEWRFILVGNLNPGKENLQYFESCKDEAGPGVSLQQNVSFETLQELYTRASVLWQFTGVTLRNGSIPQHCEHLGLVSMDAMRYGTLPVMYQRSGAAYIINHAETGFAFDTYSELYHIMHTLDSLFGSSTHEYMFNKAIEASKDFGFEHYAESIELMLNEATL